MSKQAQLLKWTLNNKNTEKEYNRRWIHPPEALRTGHVTYQVKFLGKTEASQPKGIEVVKESIQKLTFSNQLKLSEGNKIPKVELSVSIDGVAIQDIKSKLIEYQYPLHQISYCADDKSDKKFFCFIAKESDSNKHCSFVFASEKLAEEITLTIGQAFDLAYRHFLETSGKEIEIHRRMIILRKKVHDLETENKQLHEELRTLENRKRNNISKSRKVTNDVLGIKNSSNDSCPPPIQPPPSYSRQNGKNNKHQNLLEFQEQPQMEKCHDYLEDIKDLENTCNGNSIDVSSNQCLQPDDPFGMGKFTSVQSQHMELKPSSEVDKKLLKIRDGFQRGISFGNDYFSTDI